MHFKLILGIDPGFGRMGFGCVYVENGKMEAVDFGVMTTTSGDAIEDRLLHLATDLNELLAHLKPDVIAVEKLFFANNSTTAMRVAESRGVVLLLAAQAGIPVVEIGPAQVKKALTGDGAATKPAMQKMVARLLDLPRAPKPDDAADALAIAITASSMRL
jgi:crossover junction endodeoxyribonuclease RuvC